MSAVPILDELCPNCGNFTDVLNDITGFCGACSYDMGVGVLNTKSGKLKNTQNGVFVSRLEIWLRNHANDIESLMLDEQLPAHFAIKIIAAQGAIRCQCCGQEIERANGRYMFCTKNEPCRRARRYYKYLVYEKNEEKDMALHMAIEKFKGKND